MDEESDSVGDISAADAFHLGRVVQEHGEVSIVEVVRHLKYGRTVLAGYFVHGGAGDPQVLHQTITAAETEFLRRTWHLVVPRR